MSQSPVLLERRGAIAILTLNRPEVINALDAAMAESLITAITTIAEDDSVRAVVLTGAGRGFMAGGDIGFFKRMLDGEPVDIADLIERFHITLTALKAIPKPTIAAVHGSAAGAGISLMLACDFALASAETRFTLAYSRLATVPDGGSTWSLPRMVGLRKALEIALLSDAFDAAEAARLDLVNRVVAPDSVMREALVLAERLAAGPTRAYARIKGLMAESFGNTLPQQLDAERDAFAACAHEPDFREAVLAFLGKRDANFQGRLTETATSPRDT